MLPLSGEMIPAAHGSLVCLPLQEMKAWPLLCSYTDGLNTQCLQHAVSNRLFFSIFLINTINTMFQFRKVINERVNEFYCLPVNLCPSLLLFFCLSVQFIMGELDHFLWGDNSISILNFRFTLPKGDGRGKGIFYSLT